MVEQNNSIEKIPFLLPSTQSNPFALAKILEKLVGKKIIGGSSDTREIMNLYLDDDSVLIFKDTSARGADGGIYPVSALYLKSPSGEEELIWNS